MIRRAFVFSALSGTLLLAIAASAAAQDFQKSYKLGAGSQIRLGTVSGDVIVTAYDGDAVIVKATKEGRDRDQVEIEDRSTGNNIDIGVRYPKQCNCDASVKIEAQVPRSTSFRFDHISSVSGNVQVTGVTGQLKASAVSGDVHVTNVSGSVSASSVSGDVQVNIDRLEGTDDMKFSSVSGDVNVKLPSSLDAQVEISSMSGDIKNDFGIEVEQAKYGPHRSARRTLGAGARHLKMSSVSGSLSLYHN